MGLFRAINRKFEGDLVLDISVQLTTVHGVSTKFAEIPCHDGRGGTHSSIGAEIAPGHLVYFHYCGGMGFIRYVGVEESEWQEAPWMMAMKNEAAKRIADFVEKMRGVTELYQASIAAQAAAESIEALYSGAFAEDDDEDKEASGVVESGSYENLVELMNETGIASFQPFVAVEISGNVPDEVICFQMLGEDPDFLLLAKANSRLGWDGRWKTWWLTSTDSGKNKVTELEWSLTILKTTPEHEQVERLFDRLAEFLAEINGISKQEVLATKTSDESESEDDESTWIEYGASQGIYGQVIDALRFKDFSGINPEVLPSVEGVSAGPAIVFGVPYPNHRVLVVYKKNAMTWVANAMIQVEGELMQKPIDWQTQHVEDANKLADEIALLTFRMSFGDLTD